MVSESSKAADESVADVKGFTPMTAPAAIQTFFLRTKLDSK
ncbi:hypothetical protein NIES2104_26760 [Leptolyngbya sp. NIES-2104]|nr:hypothetical protein NIES2104_26760 [Leptolyngbya sp. NIES-2104]